ncbi:hypothetical protein VPH35_074014 [Triticum aestivum]
MGFLHLFASHAVFLFLSSSLVFLHGTAADQEEALRTYIVQLHPRGSSSTTGTSLSSSNPCLPYAAAALRALQDVVSVREERRVELHTTYSYRFLSLNVCPIGAWARVRYGRGVVIGVLDTGVWPESPSIDDRGMPPVPDRWRGVCETGERFNTTNCNWKLVGVRFYSKGHRANYPTDPSDAAARAWEYASPRDMHGHGTHMASTVVGAAVAGASVLGAGAGEARGVASGAHIAAYKVCWFNGCFSFDILAGMDDAVRGGVDVLSLSLGGFPIPLFEDSIAIGSFRATMRGISIVSAAGNNGPYGITALVRSAHPSWSPVMVRSAIMKTSDMTDRQGKPITDGDGGERADAFAMGAGHVNPALAVDPGLVYDIEPADYVTHHCTLGYTQREVFKIMHSAINCSELLHENPRFTLNYPSIAVAFKDGGGKTSAVLRRMVTNVGAPNSVRVDASAAAGKDSAEGYLVWKQRCAGQGRRRMVSSPIAMTWPVD